MRLALLSICLFLHGAASATTAVAPPMASPAVNAVLDHTRAFPADTLPRLTSAERRELRRLERAEARSRNRRGAPDTAPLPDSERRNGLAVASLAVGVAGVLLTLPAFLVADSVLVPVFGLVFLCALVFGAIGLGRAKRKRRKGLGLAIAGMALGIVGLAYSLLLLAVASAF